MSYCTSEDTSALLSYFDGDGNKKQVIFKSGFPLDVDINSINKERFKFDGTRKLVHFAPGDITSVSCNGTFRQISNNPATELPCTYIIDLSSVIGTKLESEFDSVYSDNSGDMEFIVSYIATDDIIRVFSGSTLIFKDVVKKPASYKLQCIREKCPEGYCECKSDSYPGFCCNNCADTAKQLRDISNSVRGINGK